MTRVAEAVGIARSTLTKPPAEKAQRGRYAKAEDAELLPQVRALVDERATYGYRRITALLNRQRALHGLPRLNHKRLYRLMRMHGLLLERHPAKRTRTHDGRIVTLKSNLRWCSDAFEIRCWNGERVQVAFSLDCCDREAMAYVATTSAITGELVRDLMAQTLEHRFGAGARQTPSPVEWLGDNGPPYTAHETCEFGRSLGLLIRTTPAYSPESNGMAEAFVKGFKRDYVYVNRLESAASVLAQLKAWMHDYNTMRPHQGLGMRSPLEFRAVAANGEAQ